MKPALWRACAAAFSTMLLILLLLSAIAAVVANASPGFAGRNELAHPGTVIVEQITDPAAVEPPLHRGDRVALADRSLSNRLRFAQGRPGDRFVLTGAAADGTPIRALATMRPQNADPATWVATITGFAFALVALVVAVRRPADPLARTLTALLLSLGGLFVSFLPWAPEWFTAVQMLLTRFCQIFCAYAALSLAVTFPYPSERGVRALLRRANPIAFAVALAMVYWGTISLILLLRPLPPWYNPLGLTVTLAYFTAITIAFVVAGRGARGADAKRLKWVGYTLALGFSGSLIETLQLALRIPILPWEYWLGLTLLAIPLGLGYAIVRHRVVDIGFVVNRALVFGSLSVIVVAAFMVLEWTLSTVAMRISHLTSTSLELALALGLGFSMRTLHARVDRFVDDLFFRDRHEAERALRTLARDIAYVSDPQVAVARVQAEVAVRSGATGAAIYVADAARALRVDPGSGGPAPAVGIDDPALVRMRATRTFVELRRVESALAGDFAFPMLVRDAVTGMLVLGPKSNGEAYAPDELATVETVTMALGNALDALQTAALRREVARVLHDGAGIDGLRGMVEPSRWARGTATQPTGPLAGLGE